MISDGKQKLIEFCQALESLPVLAGDVPEDISFPILDRMAVGGDEIDSLEELVEDLLFDLVSKVEERIKEIN